MEVWQLKEVGWTGLVEVGWSGLVEVGWTGLVEVGWTCSMKGEEPVGQSVEPPRYCLEEPREAKGVSLRTWVEVYTCC